MVNVRSLKSGLPMIIATIGITRLSTNDEMSAANARPMTKATASSTRLPRIRKSLNALITVPPSGRGRTGRAIHIAPQVGLRSLRVLGEVLTAVVTPFRADGSLDLVAFRSLCGHLVENGSDGVVVTGTTGEAPTLTDDERLMLYEAALEAVGGQATVVAGTGTYSTAHSIHLTEAADALGVDGFLVVTPYYNRPPQRGIVAHVAAVAASTDRPVVFYDIPSRVVVEAEPE